MQRLNQDQGKEKIFGTQYLLQEKIFGRFYLQPKTSHLQTLLPSNLYFLTNFRFLHRFVLDRYTGPTQVRGKINLFNVTCAFNFTPIKHSMLPHNMKNKDFGNGRTGYGNFFSKIYFFYLDDAFLCVNFFLYMFYFWVILSIYLHSKLPHVFLHFCLSIKKSI